MPEIYKSLWDILSGETFARLLKRQKKPAEEAVRGIVPFVDVNKIVNAVSPVRISEIFNFHDMLVILLCKMVILEKKVIALGQTYFAVKTRQQELIENYENLSEDQKRIAIRQEMKEHNKMLVAAAKDAGVETTLDYAIFQNYTPACLYMKQGGHFKKWCPAKMPRTGIEPVTRGFSVLCSTN